MLNEMEYETGCFPDFLRVLNEMIDGAHFINNYMSTDSCYLHMGLTTYQVERINSLELDMVEFAEKLSLFRSILIGSAIDWKEVQTLMAKDLDKEIHRMAEKVAEDEFSEEEMNLLTKIAGGKLNADRIREILSNKRSYVPWLSDENTRLFAGLLVDQKAKQKQLELNT